MIDANQLKNAIIGGAENLEKHVAQVNRINVFPVPDGDTGINLFKTITACTDVVSERKFERADELAQAAANAMLKGARGNSGVIFSIIFCGFANSIKGCEKISAVRLAKGLEDGCSEAYGLIEKPTEGTMLTVIRMAASKAAACAGKGASEREVFETAISAAKAALASTPNLLPLLKKHGVVDAGAQGLVHIMEGMLQSYSTQAAVRAAVAQPCENNTANIKYIYCTEFIVNTVDKNDGEDLKRRLTPLGDCTAVAVHSDFAKVHIHTNDPDLAIGAGLKYGELSNIKIDNMRMQS